MKQLSLVLLFCLQSGYACAASPEDLWDAGQQLPKSAELRPLAGVRFSVIQPHEPARDGYNWLHGVALAWHKGKLYGSFGQNTGSENTTGEEARGRISVDGGRTWGEPFTIDAGDEPDLAVSHGVFLSHGDTLWAFLGAFHGHRERVHTRAYTLDEASGRWLKRGVILEGGFWPMQEPQKLADGNWIMAGFFVREGNPAAVAISRGDDFARWELIVIPGVPEKMWGESTVLVNGPKAINIARYGAEAKALVAVSEDFGRTWTASQPSNLPMATSKPYAGILSDGRRYLICTTTADSQGRRNPLTIAVGEPGQSLFNRVYRIRGAVEAGPGESHEKAALSYPYAVEHDGQLYVGYSNSGGRGGNRNSAELAVIPLSSLTSE